MEKNPWKTLTQKKVYDNAWISVSHRDVITPKGTNGIYGVVHFKSLGIGIIPLDQDNNTWLVGQYRYTLNEYSWEIPEGGCPLGTSPLESAKRELKEETGIIAGQWTKFLDFHISNSVTDERGISYLARELAFGEPDPEDTEELLVKKVAFQEAYEMAMDGEIKDSLSIISILKLKNLLDSGAI